MHFGLLCMLCGASWSVGGSYLLEKYATRCKLQPLSTSAAACKGSCLARLAPCHIGCQLWQLLLPKLTLELELLLPKLTLELELLQQTLRLDPADQVNLQQFIPTQDHRVHPYQE